MGLFDLLTPVLAWIDEPLAGFLPAWLMLTLWGLVAGFATMLLFRKISNQERIAEVKKQVKANQATMASFDGEMDELLPLVGQTLRLAFKQFGLALGPALLASLPIIFVLVFLSNQYGYQEPSAGSEIELIASAPVTGLSWQPAQAADSIESGWTVSWPADGETVALSAGDLELLALPLPHPSPVVHRKKWWNTLTGNPAGYLPDDSPIDAIEIGMPSTEVLGFGPGWIRGWMFTFFLSFLVFSIWAKFALRIE